jgi:hypothetical protein
MPLMAETEVDCRHFRSPNDVTAFAFTYRKRFPNGNFPSTKNNLIILMKLVELKNGETYNGHLDACDNWMNLNLTSVICTSAVRSAFSLR